jgi:hypothetical protein
MAAREEQLKTIYQTTTSRSDAVEHEVARILQDESNFLAAAPERMSLDDGSSSTVFRLSMTPVMWMLPEPHDVDHWGSKLAFTAQVLKSLVAVPQHRVVCFSQFGELLLKMEELCVNGYCICDLSRKRAHQKQSHSGFPRGRSWRWNPSAAHFSRVCGSWSQSSERQSRPPVRSLSRWCIYLLTVFVPGFCGVCGAVGVFCGCECVLFCVCCSSVVHAGTPTEAAAVEAQAVGRVYRQGQDKQVVVIRMFGRGTYEEELYRSRFAKSGSTT